MNIIYEPSNTLQFKKPFTNGVVKENINIQNNGPNPIVFKIKTTSPKNYCVRPNSGLILSGESKEIHVLLQPMKEDPPEDFKSKDKFLVQVMEISNETADSVSVVPDIWQASEPQKIGHIEDKKFKVEFVSPEGELKTKELTQNEKEEHDKNIDSLQNIPATLNEAKPNNDDELKKLQALCEKYQKELMLLKAESRQKEKFKNDKIQGIQQNPRLLILILVAIISFLTGVIFF